MQLRGQPVANTPANRNLSDLDYNGHVCPPPEAVAGTYEAPDGTKIKVDALTDEDKLTLVRWIDLGCPLEFGYGPEHPEKCGYGWACDDQRPTLALTYPKAGENAQFTRILIGVADAYTGIDPQSLSVTADFELDGVAASQNLASKFTDKGEGVWELKLG